MGILARDPVEALSRIMPTARFSPFRSELLLWSPSRFIIRFADVPARGTAAIARRGADLSVEPPAGREPVGQPRDTEAARFPDIGDQAGWLWNGAAIEGESPLYPLAFP